MAILFVFMESSGVFKKTPKNTACSKTCKQLSSLIDSEAATRAVCLFSAERLFTRRKKKELFCEAVS